MNNLDQICFKCGIDLPIPGNKDDEIWIQNSLGVLQENGVMALFLYLYVKKKTMADKLRDFLTNPCLGNDIKYRPEDDFYENYLTKIAGEPQKLIFVKELLERVLTYARYHAKANSKPKQGEEHGR